MRQCTYKQEDEFVYLQLIDTREETHIPVVEVNAVNLQQPIDPVTQHEEDNTLHEVRSPYSLLQHQQSSDCQNKPQDESSGDIDIFTGEIRFFGGKVITWTCEKLQNPERYLCACRDPQTRKYSKTIAYTETSAVEKATMAIFQQLCDAGQIDGLTGPITIKSSKDGSLQSGIQPVEELHDPTIDVIKN